MEWNTDKLLVNAQKAARRALLVMLPLFLFLLVYPVNIGLTRWGLLLSALALPALASLALLERKAARLIPLGIALLVAVALLAPGREANPDSMKEAYLKALKSYEGCRYVWGGENSFGIDCSGLVRKALLVANVKEGFSTLNPLLLRRALWLWQRDASAKELANGYQGNIERVGDAKKINALEGSKIEPGDLAVTKDGAHVLAFIGESEWIEADPSALKVLRVKAPSDNPWFEMPVSIVRWKQLAR